MEPDARQAWVGRTEERHDVVTTAPIAALAATLDCDDPPDGAGRIALWARGHEGALAMQASATLA